MTVSSTSPKISYAGNGSSAAFAFAFRIFQEEDLRVVLRDVAGDETALALSTDYTVSAGPWESGGSVSLVTPPAVGETLLLKFSGTPTQETDYVEADAFPAETHELALDKLTMLIQQALETTGRAVTLQEATTLASLVLPDPSAGQVLYSPDGLTLAWAVLGTLTGTPLLTPVAVSDGGTGANTAAGARTALAVLGTAGGTMTGKITLDGDPTAALHAASKQYVDNVIDGLAAGQCRLDFTNTTTLTLSRLNGKRIFINGEWMDVPAGGVTVSNSGAANNTLYYVYAFNNAGTLTLERSTTAPATDSTYGHRIMTADASRTLVGMCRTNGSAQFSDDLTLSWFNKRARRLTPATLAADATGISAVASTGVAVNFLTWSGELVRAWCRGFSFNSGSNYTYTFIGFDSSAADDGGSATFGTTGAAAIADNAKNSLSEGFHTATVYGFTSAGTGTWDGSGSAGGQRLSLYVEVMG